MWSQSISACAKFVRSPCRILRWLIRVIHCGLPLWTSILVHSETKRFSPEAKRFSPKRLLSKKLNDRRESVVYPVEYFLCNGLAYFHSAPLSDFHSSKFIQRQSVLAPRHCYRRSYIAKRPPRERCIPCIIN